MATSKFRPTEPPAETSQAVRDWLDRTINEMAVLLDGAADYIDDTTLIHTGDDPVTVTGAWTFSGTVDFDSTVSINAAPLLLDTSGDNFSVRMFRNGTATGSFYHDSTAQYWMNNAGNFIIKNTYGTVDAVFDGSVTIDPDDAGPFLSLGDGTGTDGDVLLKFDMDRGFQFEQEGDDGATSLVLRSITDGKYFKILKSDSTEIYRWYGNTAGTSYADARSGTYCRFWDSTDTDYFQISQDTSQTYLKSTQHIRMQPAASHSVQIFSGSQTYLDIYDSTGSDYARHYLNGTDYYTTITNCTWWRISGVDSGYLWLNGKEHRIYDSDNSESIRIKHDGTWGVFDKGNNSTFSGFKFSPNTATTRGCMSQFTVSAADDGTASITLPAGGGIYMIVGSTTSLTASVDSAMGFWQSTGSHQSIWNAGASFWSLGTGSNPDVDGDNNVWFTSTGTVMNIKNRRGSFRYYSVWVFQGD